MARDARKVTTYQPTPPSFFPSIVRKPERTGSCLCGHWSRCRSPFRKISQKSRRFADEADGQEKAEWQTVSAAVTGFEAQRSSPSRANRAVFYLPPDESDL